jgi:Xaa-Pro aminopeptidase
MSTQHKTRIKKVKQLLSKEGIGAAIISSSPNKERSWDTTYRYRQESDFYYFTGSTAKHLSLFIRADNQEVLLFGKPVNKSMIIWEGEEESLAEVAKRIGATPVTASDPVKEIAAKLRGADILYFQNFPGTTSFAVAEKLLKTAPFHLQGLPKNLAHITTLSARLRLFKDASELSLIRKAIAITREGILAGLKERAAGALESSVAAAVEYKFRMRGAEVAFETIAGAGKSAATLHYVKCERRMKRGEMLLIDCGAEYQYYAGDITRVFPVSGSFTKEQRILYDTVFDAQKAALRTIRDGVKIKKVYDASVEVLVEGLKKLKVVKGSTQALIKKRAYAAYFPHGIGHSLGIDVHDVGELRANNSATLKTGMVFTVEPGLYFNKRAGILAPCGVRIEDDILVTKTGCEVLSKSIPKEREEIEGL